MAGQKNINIVYNVDTNSVKVATDQVTQAKLATDQLTQSAVNLGNLGSSSSKNFANDIYTLRIQMQQLKTQIELTSQSDTQTLNQRIALYKEMQSQMDKYNKGLQETKTSTESVGSSLVTLGNTVRTIITAGILKELISVNLEMAKLAGQVEGVKRAFDRLPNSIILMQDLKDATHNTIDDLTLMQKAVQAQNFKIPLEQLATLLEFASIKAQQTGLGIDYLTNSLITGLGRASIRLLDNLQISGKEITQKTKELGSQQQAIFFLVSEQMKTMGGYIDSSATKVDQLSASWKNLKIAASQTLASSGFIELLDRVVQGYTMMLKGQKQVDDEFNRGISVKYAKEFLTAENSNIEAIDKQIDKLKQEMQVRGALKATIKEQLDAKNSNGNQTMQNLAERKFNEDIIATLAQKNDITQKEIQILKQKQLQLDATNQPQKEQVGLIEALDEKIKNLNEDLIKTTSRKNIIDIQIQIKQAEAEKADLLDPDRMARQAKESFDKTNDAIRTGIRSNSETILKEVSKASSSLEDNSLFKQLNKSMAVDIKQFIAGLKLGMKEANKTAEDQQRDFDNFLKASSRLLSNNARQIANEIIANDSKKYDVQIQNLQDYYSHQEELAGNNSKRVSQLQKEEKTKEQKLRDEQKAIQKRDAIIKIEIDTAANIIKSIAQLGVPWGLVLGAEAAALGAIQIANVKKFAKGVIDLKGPGHDTSDNIPSMLSPGESVMTAQETRESGNILRAIRAKKINDQVLDKLTITTEGISANFDDTRIVNELRKGRQPDLIKKMGVIYEAKEESKDMRRIIRSKSFTG